MNNDEILLVLIDITMFGSVKIQSIGDTVDFFYMITVNDHMGEELVETTDENLETALVTARDEVVEYFRTLQ